MKNKSWLVRLWGVPDTSGAGVRLDFWQLAAVFRISPAFFQTPFFLAELGDKTMLATVTLASQYQAFVAVWLGSTLGMVAADGLAILVGKVLGRQLPERVITYGAAGLFLVTGVATLMEVVLYQSAQRRGGEQPQSSVTGCDSLFDSVSVSVTSKRR